MKKKKVQIGLSAVNFQTAKSCDPIHPPSVVPNMKVNPKRRKARAADEKSITFFIATLIEAWFSRSTTQIRRFRCSCSNA